MILYTGKQVVCSWREESTVIATYVHLELKEEYVDSSVPRGWGWPYLPHLMVYVT